MTVYSYLIMITYNQIKLIIFVKKGIYRYSIKVAF